MDDDEKYSEMIRREIESLTNQVSNEGEMAEITKEMLKKFKKLGRKNQLKIKLRELRDKVVKKKLPEPERVIQEKKYEQKIKSVEEVMGGIQKEIRDLGTKKQAIRRKIV
ncbi:hypothetical protein KY345_04750 [Candidatus Woesearchaeota archaeon]|nr:hypothetical protein [Candidatus Woesearchaeota archaeon]